MNIEMEELLETLLTYLNQEDVNLNVEIKSKTCREIKTFTVSLSGRTIINCKEIDFTAEVVCRLRRTKIKSLGGTLPSIDERFPVN